MRTLARLINQIFSFFKPKALVAAIVLLSATGAAGADSIVSEKDLSHQLGFYAGISELRTTFRQIKHLSEMNLDLKSEGRLSFKKPDDVTWDVLKPSPITVKMSNAEITVISPSGTQTYKIQDLSQDNVARGIGQLKPWLTLDAHALSDQYKITKPGEREFLFQPKSSASSIGKIKMGLSPSGQLNSLRLFENSGDWIDIQFGPPKITRKSL